VENDEMDMP